MTFLLAVSVALAEPTWSEIQADAGWQVISHRDHPDAGPVEVLERHIAGIDCFQASAVADLSLTALTDVVTDIVGSKKWSSAGLSEAKVLASAGTTIDYYQYLDTPSWTLAADRFWFLHGTLEKTSDRVVFRWERLAEGGPYNSDFLAVRQSHDGAIEPPVNVGGWLFQTEGTGSRIRYFICSDTGGAIPVTVQSLATKKTLPDTVGDVVRETRRRQGG